MKLSYRLLVDTRRHLAQLFLLLGLTVMLGINPVAMASVINSKHNLSSSGPGPVKATSETQICVFCHTPHGGDQTAGAPLWNRMQSTATYIPYLSSSMAANQPPGQPGANSKVCLSCHDGTMAIGTVGNLNGRGANITMIGTGPGGVIAEGSGATTGYTRDLGVDLTNDHPISFIYDTTLANNDGELRDPSLTPTIVGSHGPGVNPTFPLENDGQMQCPTCHDPHLSTSISPKFLRGLRLQQTAPPSGGLFSPSKDIMCLACHDKDKAGPTTWSNSAHATNTDPTLVNEAYTDAAADIREFPHGTTVWQASCLNCHDTHTLQGARHLLREGAIGGRSAIEETCYQCHRSAVDPTNILGPSYNTAPDIKTDFDSPNFRMPVGSLAGIHDIGGVFDDTAVGGGLADNSLLINGLPAGSCDAPNEQCGKDFMEPEALLGRASATMTIGGIKLPGSISNRHTECTDCHNPHRTTKFRQFSTNASVIPDEYAAGTHKHNILSGDTVAHSNIASGSLRGIFGVEPVYNTAAPNFVTPDGIPSAFTVKRGDPGLTGTLDVNNTYVTREYQVCLKCHSNYAYDNPDSLGSTNNPGGTSHSTNGFDTYLNTAMELQAPATDKGNQSFGDSGAYATTYSANNQRSWHPVLDSTGRTMALRTNNNPAANPNLWRSPWNGSDSDGGTNQINSAVSRDGSTIGVTGAVGYQTMYCSDCHGSYTNPSDGVVPVGGENGSSWGPHGSIESFILKGPWNTTAEINPTSAPANTLDVLCFRCHAAAQYADPSPIPPATTLPSGFGNSNTSLTDIYGQPITNLHQRHAYYTTTGGVPAANIWPATANNSYRCTMCHTGTAHGWKNKAFLVNLNDVGPEVDRAINGTAGGAIGTSLGGTGEIAPGPITLATGDPVPQGTQVPAGMASVPTGYTNGPYYQGALLYIANTGFKASGTWTKADCTNAGCH